MKMLSGLISAVVRQFHGTFERGGMVSSTCVDDFVLMGEIEGAHKLKGELSHEECRDSIVREPDTKGRQGLAHELEDETHVRAVGPCELKVVDQVADVFVAQELAVSIAEPTEDLSLEDGMFMAVAFVTQDFEGRKRCSSFGLVILGEGGGEGGRWTYSLERSLTSQTVEYRPHPSLLMTSYLSA